MDYKGVIIEESLENADILNDVRILSTKVEDVTEGHKTPWIKQWTLHTVEVADEKAEEIAERLNADLEKAIIGTQILKMTNITLLSIEARYLKWIYKTPYYIETQSSMVFLSVSQSIKWTSHQTAKFGNDKKSQTKCTTQ